VYNKEGKDAAAAKPMRSDEVGVQKHVEYKDGVKQTVQLEELSELKHQLTWRITESSIPLKTLGHVSTVTLRPVTISGGCFLQWRTAFGAQATLTLIEDARFKQRDCFEQIRSVLQRQQMRAASKRKCMLKKIEFATENKLSPCPAYVSSNARCSRGLLVLSEWWGANSQMKKKALKLARSGYRTIVIDFYRGT
jgi:hypothetical protein